MMKRICAFMALVLALSCVPALAAEGDALVGRSDEESIYFNQCFTDGETLYLDTYEGTVYTYRVGDADLQVHGYANVLDGDEDIELARIPFADGDKLYAIDLLTRSDEHTEFVGARLTALTPQADGDFACEMLAELDWEDMVEYYDENAYPTRPDAVIGVGGKAVMRYNDASGDWALATIDLVTGAIEPVNGVESVYAFAPYRDGQLLVESFDYSSPTVAILYAFDPASDSATLLCQTQIEDYAPLQGIAYDAASDAVYCVKSGEVMPVDLQTGEVGEGLTDMPLEPYGNAASACVLNGGYYVYCNEGVAVRNLDPAQRASSRLKINDYTWNESVNNAYYRFSNAHGDVSVVLSRDYSESANVIDNMMNRDGSVDIYVLSASSAAYDALFNRGYLMELDGSAGVCAFADGMYPALREQVSTDGHVVALPVSVYGTAMGIGEDALKAMGMNLEDVPDNWSDFLDFLHGLEGRVDDANAQVFYSGYSAQSARYGLFISIFESYQRYVSLNDAFMGFDTPLLRGLLEKLERIDFTALGCPDQADMDEETDYYEDNRPVLVQPDCGCTIGGFYNDATTPVLMGLDADTPCPLTLEVTMAFVNPFTQNLDTALAFMDELAANLSESVRYNLIPGLTEPVRGKWNEQAMAETGEVLAGLRDDLAQAEPADRQMLEETIADVEASLQDMEQNSWEIGPKDIEWYRAHDDNLALAPYNWLYDSDGEDSAGGEAWTLINQYSEGQIDAATLLSSIDRKVQMMLQEGR